MNVYEQDVLEECFLVLSYTDPLMKERMLRYRVSSAKIDHDTILYRDLLGKQHAIPYVSKYRAVYLLPYPFDGDPTKVTKLK